jgi:hypothetical protein
MGYGRGGCAHCVPCYLDIGPGTRRTGEACDTDCDCVAGLSCVGYSGEGTGRACFAICETGLDCAVGQLACGSVVDGPAFVCVPRTSCDSQPCPAGFSCVRGETDACLDQRDAMSLAPCRCDLDCPDGLRCLETFGASTGCAVPCVTGRDCPASYFICTSMGFCRPPVK